MSGRRSAAALKRAIATGRGLPKLDVSLELEDRELDHTITPAGRANAAHLRFVAHLDRWRSDPRGRVPCACKRGLGYYDCLKVVVERNAGVLTYFLGFEHPTRGGADLCQHAWTSDGSAVDWDAWVDD